MTFALTELAAAIGISGQQPEVHISKWSIDSRTMEAGCGYFAFAGERTDGHDYLAEVGAKKAAVAIVRHGTEGPPGLTLLRVADPLRAMVALARAARAKLTGPVAGITGSAGKTSTKDILWSLLSVDGLTGRTDGNFNNHIGVPLTFLRQPEGARAHVIELAMNHRGEIRDLCSLAQPQIGIVTNVGYAHTENFEDGIEGIAAAKRELIEALPASGTAVLNADDARVAAFAGFHSGKTLTYGIENEADVRAEDVALQSEGVQFRVKGVAFRTAMTGRHAVLNILAGIAVAGLLGTAPERLQDAVSALRPGKMRGERITHHGIEIINDSYNSNPEAVRAMIDVLAARPERRKIAVLGEMKELGQWTESLHREAGKCVARAGIDLLVGVRGAASFIIAGSIEEGLDAGSAIFFQNPEEAGDYLKRLAQAGDVILFKGSRGTRVELALERFLA